MAEATLIQRVLAFLRRTDPIAFCVRVVPLLIILPLLTLTAPFERLVQTPLVMANANCTYWLVSLFGAEVTQTGPIINSTGGYAIEVIPGCTALYTLLILYAMILAFPSRWITRLLGLLVGTAVICTLNLTRLVTLFFIGKHYRFLFDEAHLFVWQTITIVIALVFWYAWARRALRGLESPGPAAGAVS